MASTTKTSPFQTPLTVPRENQDPRVATAYNLLNAYQEGLYLVHKTTRAGCTTALVAESLNRREQFLVVVPTNKIADKTVIADSIKYSDRDSCNVIHIPSNHACLKNQELCELYPDLEKLPILPLAEKCSECEDFYNCPVTRIIHEGRTCDGIALTYQKLVALMMASMSRPNTTAEHVLDTISRVHNALFDEVHEIQYGKSTGIIIYNDARKDQKQLDTSNFQPVMDEYPHIRKIVANFEMLRSEQEVKSALLQTYNNAADDNYYRHKLSITVQNSYNEFEDDQTKFTMAVYSEIIHLTKDRKRYGLSMVDVLNLYKILGVVTSERVVIHGIRDRGFVKIRMVAVDQMFTRMLKSYIMSIQNKASRTLLTSATICSHDYDQYFMGDSGPKNITFGTGGDPMNTNSKMLILADSKKYGATGRNSRYNKKHEILQKITTLLDLYGDDDCIIITLSIKEAAELQDELKRFGHPHPVTYYKAPEMMGVSADARVMIAVGVADKPSNSFDAITETKEESLVLREEAVHCDTWQAWSRVKDPNGEVPSLVFALGCSVEQCENVSTWGFGRTVEICDYSANQKKIVNIHADSKNITKPIIKKCKDFDKMLSEADKHKQTKKVFISKSAKVPIYYIIGRFDKKQMKIFSQSELIKLLVNREDVYAEQSVKGSYFKVSGTITDKMLQNHVDGKITIGTYTLNNANEVTWMCYDIDAHLKEEDSEEEVIKKQQNADIDKDKICNFLESVNLPYMLEASGTPHSYHIWLFLEPVKATKAKELGKMILKECGVKCELFPKQCKITKNGYGNLVKLPFATHRKNGNLSKIFIDGEFVREFESYDVGIIDISSFELPKKKSKCNVPKPKHIGNLKRGDIRPIFKWALTQRLEHEEGHWMRIGIVREYYNSGMTDPDDLARLFSNQPDYIFDYSREKVMSIICVEMPPWRWETVVDKCPSFVRRFDEYMSSGSTEVTA